ncbi:ABC transporter substrate-binding protein, partial [Citrobacter sp. AAK_AS5]
VDLKIIGIFSRAPEAFTILAKNPAISSVKDLKGKKIVGPKGTLLHQLLIAALARDGLKPTDVEFLSMGLMEGVAAMLS